MYKICNDIMVCFAPCWRFKKLHCFGFLICHSVAYKWKKITGLIFALCPRCQLEKQIRSALSYCHCFYGLTKIDYIKCRLLIANNIYRDIDDEAGDKPSISLSSLACSSGIINRRKSDWIADLEFNYGRLFITSTDDFLS